MYVPSPAWPHGALTPFFDDLFYVQGQNRVRHGEVDLCTSRTMLVVREGRELTLVNTVRLDDAGLAALDALGEVRRVVRLGAFHGRDDPFYCDRYRATLFALAGALHGDGRATDVVLHEDGPGPVAGARVFAFVSAKHPEAALLLPNEGGVLVTCDAVQNWVEADRYFSPETGKLFSDMGFLRPANVPATFLQACEPARADYDRLLALDFAHLVTAHGEPLLHVAKARIAASVAGAFETGRGIPAPKIDRQ